MTKDEALKEEPVAWVENYKGGILYNPYPAARNLPEGVQFDLYAAPQKRQWVSLTDEQKDRLLLHFGSYWVIDAIEAMLKENNGV